MIYGEDRPSVHVQLKIAKNTCGSYLNLCGQMHALSKFMTDNHNESMPVLEILKTRIKYHSGLNKNNVYCSFYLFHASH